MFELSKVPDQSGKIAIVTGANAGLGYETALALAQKGAGVILACRNLEKGASAKKAIQVQVPKASLTLMQLDLASLDSVRHFVDDVFLKYSHIDLLIENAGIMIPPFSKTEDGFESQMGVNYFGHFLLTNLLLPLLSKAPAARIVTLSSKAHEQGKIDFDNLNAEKGYSKMGAYSQSKLACLMFAFELQRRLEKAGSPVMAVSAHPGVSFTELFRAVPKGIFTLVRPVFSLLTHDPQNAALPALYAAIGHDVEGGEYFGPTGFLGMKGKPGKVRAKAHAHDGSVAKKLWSVSEGLTKQKFEIQKFSHEVL